jgi:hypothetical protein
MHPELGESRFLNALMYRNRADLFRRLERLFASGLRVVPYAEYVATSLAGNEAAAAARRA